MILFARQLLLSLTLLNALSRNSQTKGLTTERISWNNSYQHQHHNLRLHRVNDSSAAPNRSRVAVPSGAVNSVRHLQRTTSRDDDRGESGSSDRHVLIGQDRRRRRRRREKEQLGRRIRRFVIGTNSNYAKQMNDLPADLSTRMKATDAAEMAVVAALKKRDRMSVEALKRTLRDARTDEWQVLKQLLTASEDDKAATKLYSDYKKLRRGRPNLNAMMDEENKNFFFSSMDELNEYTQIKKEELDVDKYLASTQVAVQRPQAPPQAPTPPQQAPVVSKAPKRPSTVPPSILPPVLPPPSMPPSGQPLKTLPGTGRPLPSQPTPLASSEPRSGGSMVWIIVGVCAGLALLGLISWAVFSKKKQSEKEEDEQEPLNLKKDSISDPKRDSFRDSMVEPMGESEMRRDSSKPEKKRWSLGTPKTEAGGEGSKADIETDQKRDSKALAEPKRDSKAESVIKRLSLSQRKSDAKRGSKADPTAETKAGPDAEIKTEPRRESKAGPKTETPTAEMMKPESKMEPRKDSKAVPQTEAKRESMGLAKIESPLKPEPRRESKAEPRRESKKEPEAEEKKEEKTGLLKKIKKKMSSRDKKDKKGVVPIEEQSFLSPAASEKEISSTKFIPPPPLSEPGESAAPPLSPPGEVPKPPIA